MHPTDSAMAAPYSDPERSGRCFWWAALLPPLLALLVMAGLFQLDRPASMQAMQSLTLYLPDTFWAGATLLGNGAMVLACLSLAWRRRPDWLMAGLCALPFATLISRGFKLGIDSPRPAALLADGQLHIIGERLLNHSLPSGHTLTAFVAAAIILLAGRAPRAWALAAVLLATLVGLSRIAVGAHWPTDVLAGAAGGWLAGAIGVALARRWAWTRTPRAEWLMALIVLCASLGLFFVNIGYQQAILFKYLVAAAGTMSALRWLLTRWQRC